MKKLILACLLFWLSDAFAVNTIDSVKVTQSRACQNTSVSISIYTHGFGSNDTLWSFLSLIGGSGYNPASPIDTKKNPNNTYTFSYTIPLATTPGGYRIYVKGTGTSPMVDTFSNPFFVDTTTAITTQPSAQTKCAGQSATFSVVAVGAGTLSYVWKKGTTPVGSNSPTYTIPAVALTDAGNYSVEVTSSVCGMLASSSVALTVNDTVKISSQPGNATTCAGSGFSFSVSATGGGTLSYQWKKGGIDIGGATNSTYAVSNASLNDAGSYSVLVTSSLCGSKTSATATLTVNDTITISTQPAGSTVCAGANVTFSVLASGSGTISYQWRKGVTNIPSANSSSYTITGAGIADAGVYSVVVSSTTCGSVTSSPATLVVNDITKITGQPNPATICSGSNGSLSVTATGSGTLSYQWRRRGVNVPSGNAATLSFSPATIADTGLYDVVVNGTCGTATSNAVTVTVNAITGISTQPASVTTCSGDSVRFTVVASGTPPLTYQWKKNTGNIPSANASSYFISSVNGADAGSYTVLVTGACGNVTSQAAILTINSSTSFSKQPVNTTVCAGSRVRLSATANGTGTVTYQWRKNKTNIPSANADTLIINAASAGDIGTYDVVATSNCGTKNSDSCTLSVNPLPAKPVAGSVPSTVCNNQQGVNFSVTSPGGNAVLWSCPTPGVVIKGTQRTSCLIDFPATGSSYDIYCSVSNTQGCRDSLKITVNVNGTIGTVPVIKFLDGKRLVCMDNTQPSYQWGYDDAVTLQSTDIAGEKFQDYTLPAGFSFATKNYYVKLSSGNCTYKVYYNAPLSVALKKASESLSVFPNPNNGVLNIRYAGNGTNMAYITDAAGRTVMNLTLQSGDNSVSADLPSGFYTLHFQSEESTDAIKLIINR